MAALDDYGVAPRIASGLRVNVLLQVPYLYLRALFSHCLSTTLVQYGKLHMAAANASVKQAAIALVVALHRHLGPALSPQV